MKVSVFGMGYVGLVTSICLASEGHRVHGIDNIASKIDALNAKNSTIYEPNLNELLADNLNKNIHFSTNAEIAIADSEALIICAGTPTLADGSVDTSMVFQIVDLIAKTMTNDKLIIIKSTLPVGSFITIEKKITSILKERDIRCGFSLVTNPEFLREGSAIADYQNPDRIIIGTNSSDTHTKMKELYRSQLAKKIPFLFMDPSSAEMTKYAANSFLAAKTSLINEFAKLCEKVGADIEFVRQGVSSDHRIGPEGLFAGLGYGGSCFPKDIEALIQIGRKNEVPLNIISAIDQTNNLQVEFFTQKIVTRLKNLQGKTISFWGASFKPNTDDIREAPALKVIHQLLKLGANISIFDPAATGQLNKVFQNQSQIVIYDDQYQALQNGDALVIATEWNTFKDPNFQQIKTFLKTPLIFDGRNIYNPTLMQQAGFEYHSVGRASL